MLQNFIAGALVFLLAITHLAGTGFTIDGSVGPPLPVPGEDALKPMPYIEGGELVVGRQFPWVGNSRNNTCGVNILNIVQVGWADGRVCGTMKASLRVAGYHFCGANIVNSEWVLGVASCMFYNWNSYSVEVGTNSLDTGGTIHNVTEVVMHEAYNESNSWINDIVLLKVSPPIKMGDGVSPVVLADKEQITPVGTPATIAGWGALKYFDLPANDLHKIEVDVYDHKKCEEAYAPIPKKIIYPTQICAASKEDRKGPTNGDSAAPLTVDGKVVGLLSWERNVNELGYPAVYTEVSHYVDWINDHMKD